MTQDRQSDEIQLFDIFQLLRRNISLIALISGTFFTIFMIVFLFFLTPEYEVTATIKPNEQDNTGFSINNPMALMLGKNIGNKDPNVVELLRTRQVIDETIHALNLQYTVTEQNRNMFSYIINALSGIDNNYGTILIRSAPPSFKHTPAEVTVTHAGYAIETTDESKICDWNEECNFSGGKINLSIVGSPIPEDTVYVIEYQKLIENRIFWAENLTVFNIEETNLVRLIIEGSNPSKSQIVLKKLLERYSAHKEKWNDEESRYKQLYISEILTKLRDEITQKNKKLIAFQKNENSYIPSLEFRTLAEKKEKMRAHIDMEHVKLKVLRTVISELQKNPAKPIAVSLSEEELPLLHAIRAHNNRQMNVERLKETLTENHPDFIKAENELRKSGKNLEQLFMNRVESISQTISALKTVINVIEKKQKKVPENLLTFEALKRDIQLSEKVYVALSSKLYETMIDKNTGVPVINIVDPPSIAVQKSFPRTFLFFAISLLTALFFGLLSFSIIEFFRTKVLYYKDIQKKTDITSVEVSADNMIKTMNIHIEKIFYENISGQVLMCISSDNNITTYLSKSLMNHAQRYQSDILAIRLSTTGHISSNDFLTEEYDRTGSNLEIIIHPEAIPQFLTSSRFTRQIDTLKKQWSLIILCVNTDHFGNIKKSRKISDVSDHTIIGIRKSYDSLRDVEAINTLFSFQESILFFFSFDSDTASLTQQRTEYRT